MTDLAAEISKNATLITEYLAANKLPAPSFAADGPVDFPLPSSDGSLQAARIALLSATKTLYALTQGPTDTITNLPTQEKLIQAALAVVSHYRLAEYVPASGSISFLAVATAAKMDLDRVTRILRLLMTEWVFTEPRESYVAHTATSKLLLHPLASAWVGHNMSDILPAVPKMIETFDKYKTSIAPEESPVAVAFGQSFFDLIKQDYVVATRVGDSMAWLAAGAAYDASHTVAAFDWEKLGDGTVVDVGGSHGFISIAIAKQYPRLKFIVQDQAYAKEGANATIPKELKLRVSFMTHDFFDIQPVQDATAYLFRQVLHNWSHPYALEIIRAIVPALKNGDRLLICDNVASRPNTEPAYVEKVQRGVDMQMMLAVNAGERTLSQWQELIELADARFRFAGVVKPAGSKLSLLEAVFVSVAN
ncbi:MAG: hypothetical protein M1838_004401 [Thelocarpon superellum]|nr:MAG: hypothetical protein M1838_004401 [Thelocarpon superellum]